MFVVQKRFLQSVHHVCSSLLTLSCCCSSLLSLASTVLVSLFLLIEAWMAFLSFPTDLWRTAISSSCACVCLSVEEGTTLIQYSKCEYLYLYNYNILS